MKLLIFPIMFILMSSFVLSAVIFQDDFENGLGNWDTYEPGFSNIDTEANGDSRACPGSFSSCGSDGLNQYAYVYWLTSDTPNFTTKAISTLGYEDTEVSYYLKIDENMEEADVVLVLHDHDNDHVYIGIHKIPAGSNDWTKYSAVIPALSDKSQITVRFTYGKNNIGLTGDTFYIDDFQITGNLICGNNIVDQHEECDPPGSIETETCGSDIGECKTGLRSRECHTKCNWMNFGDCEGAIYPQDEVCDGLDNDCNGVIDNGVLNACGECGPVPEEICDGLDNDCDGETDEGVLNACGECGPVPEEICDGLDNDCDGVIDNSVLNACGECGPLPGEVCDGLDNDCNQLIDDGLGSTTCGMGVCEVTMDNCLNGTPQVCVPSEPASDDDTTCNNEDDDCDGDIDEDYERYTCGQGVCLSFSECIDGTEICEEDEPEAEVCNGLDDDCDGDVDEGLDFDFDGVCNIDDNCPIDANPLQGDEDVDGVGDICDACLHTQQAEPVDQLGCSNPQFCRQFSCGGSCVKADWLSNEAGSDRPRDCLVAIVTKAGTHYPICAGCTCAD